MVVVVLGTAMARVLSVNRQFPGQRIRGATNYGTHSFGPNGFVNRPVARVNRRFGKWSSRKGWDEQHGGLTISSSSILYTHFNNWLSWGHSFTRPPHGLIVTLIQFCHILACWCVILICVKATGHHSLTSKLCVYHYARGYNRKQLLACFRCNKTKLSYAKYVVSSCFSASGAVTACGGAAFPRTWGSAQHTAWDECYGRKCYCEWMVCVFIATHGGTLISI